MTLLRRLIPGALKRLDRYLQLSHPRLWSTRFHYNLWFLFLVNLITIATGCLVRVSSNKFPDPEELFAYMILPMVIYFVFWVYKVVLFNVEKRFGKRKPFAEIGEFLVHGVSVLLIMTIPYALLLTISYRIGHLVSDEEFVQDVDLLNDQAYHFYDGLEGFYDYNFNYSDVYMEGMYRQGPSHHYFRSLEEYVDRRIRTVNSPRSLQAIYNEYRGALDKLRYEPDSAASVWYQARLDSIKTNFPIYFVRHGRFTPVDRASAALPFKNRTELEEQYISKIKNSDKPDSRTIQKALELFVFYRENRVNNRYDEGDPDRLHIPSAAEAITSYNELKNTAAPLDNITHQLQRIWKAKTYDYGLTRGWDPLLVALVLAFCAALLISIFKNVYWQPFVIALVTGLLLPLVLLLISLISEHGIVPYSNDVIMIYTAYLIAVLIIIFGIRAYRSKRYNTTKTVTTILANVIVPFFLVSTLLILHVRWDMFGEQELRSEIRELWSEQQDLHPGTEPASTPQIDALGMKLQLLVQEINSFVNLFLWGGLVLYIMVFHRMFRAVYTRLYALPEPK